MTATAAGLAGSPVIFTASGTAGAATKISSNSATTQSATVGTAVGAPPSVLVQDASNNPVAGVNVTFAVTGGAGSLGAPLTVATNASGIATIASWTLGTDGRDEQQHGDGDGGGPGGEPGDLYGERDGRGGDEDLGELGDDAERHGGDGGGRAAVGAGPGRE